jgi:hypothetical protein
MSRCRVLRRTIAGALLAVAVAGLPRSAAALDRVTYLLPAPIFLPAFGPWVVARQRGYYAAEGLEIDFETAKGGADVAKQIGVGNAVVGGAMGDTPIIVRGNGVPVKSVAVLGGQGLTQLVVHADSDIKGPADLKGKTVNVTAYQETTYYATLGMLAAVGLTKNDVNIQAAGSANIWKFFLGDAKNVSPPPLEQEVPEELTKPDEFIWFRLPTEVWQTNWLLAVDGSDAFHAVVLHASSQAVTGKTWTSGQADHSEVPLAERKMKIVKTSHGIRGVSLDAQGNPLHHGHFTVDVKGDRFALPCIHTNPIMPAPGAVPYTSRLWQFAIDEKRTQIVRYAVWRARTSEERETATRVLHDLALPRLQKVSAEDAFAAEAQGDVVTARQEEHLLAPDVDVVNVRRLIRKAFLSPIIEHKRIGVSDGALRYPL